MQWHQRCAKTIAQATQTVCCPYGGNRVYLKANTRVGDQPLQMHLHHSIALLRRDLHHAAAMLKLWWVNAHERSTHHPNDMLLRA